MNVCVWDHYITDNTDVELSYNYKANIALM